MISPDLLEVQTQRVGGRFRLTTLLQKRSRELCLGAPPLAERRAQAERPHETAIREVEGDHIYLASPDEALAEQVLPESPAES